MNPHHQLIIHFTYDNNLQRHIEAVEETIEYRYKPPRPMKEVNHIISAVTSVVFIDKIQRFFKQTDRFNNSKITCRVSEDYVTGAAKDLWFIDICLIVSEVVNPHNTKLGLEEVELKFMKP